MRVALVHDDLVQWGGAEKVLWAISEMFPEAPIYTSVFDKENSLISEKFGTKKIITSFLQKIPGWKSLYRPLLPLYPMAFESFDFSEFDVLAKFTGTHPAVMNNRIQRKNWQLDLDVNKKKLSLKNKMLHWYEKKTGKRLFSFTNYRII